MYKVFFPEEPQEEGSVAEEQKLGQFIPLHYHANMLLDCSRVEAFQQAIDSLITANDIVLELGGGTGILSFFAARRGAKVYCVEQNPALVKSATAFLKMNHCGCNVEVIQADAMYYLPPEPVDFVICEMLHVAMIREKQLAVIHDWKHRYLKKYSAKIPRFIPEASLLAVQAVHYDYHFCGYHAPIPVFQNPVEQDERTCGITEPAIYSTICYDGAIPLEFSWNEVVPVIQSGSINALRFVTKNLLVIDTQSKQSVDWSNQFLVLPIQNPMEVKQGDAISITLNYREGCTLNELSQSLRVEVLGNSRELNKSS